MKAEPSDPIPIPWRERLRDARLRVLPVVVFVGALVLLAALWKDYVSAPSLVGQAEALQANVSCAKGGMVAQLNVTRFQHVKAGDEVGQVLVTDPKILASSLAVIQAEIEMLRVNMLPIATQQRAAMDYSQLRLDWMRQRTQLEMAKINLQLAETDLRRKQELFQDKIVAERALEQARAERDRLKKQVEELTWLVEEQARNFEALQLTNTLDIAKVSDLPLRAAIAAQDAKLRLTEAELSPIRLQAPVDGTITAIYHRSGEAIVAGEPILAVAAANPTRIVTYLRPPIGEEPAIGTRVQVRTRGHPRQIGLAQIMEIGTQFENPAPALQTPMKLATVELALPIGISVPPNLSIRSGEVVDLIFLNKPERGRATE